MKKIITFLTFVFLFKMSAGQDTIRDFEFGSTLLTVNVLNTNPLIAADRLQPEFLNGVFFRYTKKRIGIRFHTSYSKNYVTFETPKNFADGVSGDSNNKIFLVGVGGQFSPIKQQGWVYTFLDLSYRNQFSTGHIYGGIAGTMNRLTSTSNGADCFFGLGFKIKMFRNVYLSPELGYYVSNRFVNRTSTDLRSGKTSKYSYTETYQNPLLKLHLTAKF